MSDLDLKLRIEALVKGQEDIRAAVTEVKALSQAASQPLRGGVLNQMDPLADSARAAGKEFQTLIDKLNPMKAHVQAFSRDMALLNQAKKDGTLKSNEYAQALDRLDKHYQGLEANARKAEDALTGAAGAATQTGGASGYLRGELASLGTQMVAGLGAAELLREGLAKLQEGMRGAMQEQRQKNALAAALQDIGQYSAESMKKVEDFANAMKLAGFSDEETRDGIIRLLPVTRDLGAAIDGVDVAYGAFIKRQKPVAESLEIIAGILGTDSERGLTTAQREFGIALNESASTADKQQSALHQLSGRYAGIAQNTRDATAATQSMGILWDDLWKGAGKELITVVDQLTRALHLGASAFDLAEKAGARFVNTIAAVAMAKGLIEQLKLFGVIGESPGGVGAATGATPDLDAAARRKAEQAKAQAEAEKAAEDEKKNREERVKRLAEAWAEEERQQQAAADRIATFIERLRTEADTLGMTREQLVAYEMAKMGASKATIQEAQALARTLEARKAEVAESKKAAEEEKRRQDAVNLTMDGLQTEAAEAGLNARQKLLLRLETLRATEAERALALQLFDTAQALNREAAERERARQAEDQRVDRLRSEADQIRAMLSPLEQIRQAIQRVQEMGSRGLLDATQVATQLNSLKLQYEQAAGSWVGVMSQAAQRMQGAFEQFFYDPFKDGLKGLLNAFVDTLRKMASEWLSQMLVMQITRFLGSMAGGGTGGLFSMAAGALAGTGHTGAVIGGASGSRIVSPLVFAGAPRLHTGALLGLQKDEVPFIGLKGEEVLSKSDPRNAANGGGKGGGGNIRILNVLDPNMVGDYLNSASGEKVQMNFISKNAGAIKQILTQN